MEVALGSFALVNSTGTIIAFGWASSLLYRRTTIKEMLALTVFWALVVAGWVNFVAIAIKVGAV
jgi:hypothetical protein